MHNKGQSSSEILLCNYQNSVSCTKYNFLNPESVAPKNVFFFNMKFCTF